MNKVKIEIKILFILLTVFFIGFLGIPLGILLFKSVQSDSGFTVSNYINIFSDKGLLISVKNSLIISTITAVLTTGISFLLAYSVNRTRIFKPLKKAISLIIILPMLLPTITYGFAIIYSFGKQGLLTKLFGKELFQIYGFNGLLIGYIIYTIPSAFLLINNSFKYIDEKYIVVSELMGDNKIKSFINTLVRPLIGTIGGTFVLTFILTFTDFGIPASVGGTFEVVSVKLYKVMLGAIPDFNAGAAIAVIMLIPAVFGVILLKYLEKYNFHYDKITKIDKNKNKFRDITLGSISLAVVVSIIAIFAVMFVSPVMKNFPYDMSFTMEYVVDIFSSNNMIQVYKNSLIVASFTAIFGVIFSFFAAIINTRSNINKVSKSSIDIISIITNTVPGMVLGIAYLTLFNGSSLKGGFLLIIICNIVHFFATPYLMAKNSLSKMNQGWETTAELLGDTWIKTIFRVVIPNSISTIIEMFSYYFVNSMVTISALVFLVGVRSAVVTTEIKELQHFAKFNEIFILSILIFVTNLIVKLLCDILYKKKLSINKKVSVCK